MRFFLNPRLFFSSLLFFFGCALSVPAQTAAPDVVWSGLLYATTEEHPAAAPKELAAFSSKLQNIFGYNQIQLLSQHREIMDGSSEHWLLPGNGFNLRVNTKKAKAHYLLNLQLYLEKRLLVQTEAQLARQSPLFLRGPLCGDGQLIFVLLVE